MDSSHDSSWDLRESEEGNLPYDDNAFERKYDEWLERDRMDWLQGTLRTPCDEWVWEGLPPPRQPCASSLPRR